MPSAEIITIGTEILLGEIVDTNTRYIARNLRDLGVDLYRTITIGDNVERIAESIRESMQRAEIIITTGGLGPTVDDPTRQAVALAMGVETEFRAELWEQISERISRYGRKPGENQKRQAYMPQGAIAIDNPVGTAPAFIVETEHNAIISLPGVPREMETLLHQSVIPYLQSHYDLHEVIIVRLLHTAGIGEGRIDEKIGDLEELSNPTVGLAAHAGIVDVRLAAKADTEAEASRMIAEVEADIRQRLGKVVFGADQDTLEGVTLEALAQRGWTLAAVEFGLDGKLARRLAASPNPVLLETNLTLGLLPERTRAARQEQNAQAALGVAFFPGEEQQTVEICVITPNGEKTRQLTYGGHPHNTSRWAVSIAINMLRRAVASNS
ncbi:MAG: competence/damage-inducible protein A [Chloroflexi bacterium]|nr:competence/damage-inducible protein A [Chloroflexota bacterium]